MYAVGKLGSYISQGVYTVAGPFHPFGGAVDIIVVQQEDGTFKSSPWHVKFGKFQGVLKTREKVVNICVNGVEAGFHMYLNHKGEAYFLQDSDDDDDVDAIIEKILSPRLEKAMSPRLETVTSSRRSRIFGLFGGRSMKKVDVDVDVDVDAERRGSLERAETTVDLLDMKWSTDLAFGKQISEEKRGGVTILDSATIPADVLDSPRISEEKRGGVTILDSATIPADVLDSPKISEEKRGGVTILDSATIPADVLDSPRISEEKRGGVTILDSATIPADVLDSPRISEEKGDGLGRNPEEAACEVSKPVLIESDECNISSERSVLSNSTSDLEEATFKRVGSSTVDFEVTSDQADKDLDISFEGSRLIENPCEVLCESSVQMSEANPEMESDEFTCEVNNGAFGFQDSGISEVESSYIVQNAPPDSPRYESSVSNGSSDEVPLNSCFTESQVIYKGKPADDVHQAKETIGEAMKVIEDQSLTNTESSGSTLHYPVTNEIFSISDDEAQDSKVLEDRSNVEVILADTMKDEVFHFTDIDCFSGKETSPQEPHNDAVLESDVGVLVTDCDAAQHELEDGSSEGSLECVPEVPGSQTSPMSVPRRRTYLEDGQLLAKSLPIMHSEIDGIEASNLLHPLSCSLDSNFEGYEGDLLKKEFFLSSKLEMNYEVNMSQDNHIPEAVASTTNIEQGDEATTISPRVELPSCKNLVCEGMGADVASSVEKDVENHSIDPSLAIVSSEESWKLWPFSFKKSKSISTVRSLPESVNRENVEISLLRSQTVMVVDKVGSAKFIRKKVRSLTPTTEELASLNLKEGQNMITFSFSTAMLGQQQVDARIYLWKWNTRIVISDVDGTITKSDVLGQFMPLVGLDWYQTGVVHLFSAIKENGYQMLFLSARSISQAYLTRQFLSNLRQDGKLLPDGPVVISPDGLFPSLYREVIRRVPHEFKISCLEEIKALFPQECNPFYAGFGNRDTDEISYLKVGISKGKILIVNPKGEIAMNRRVDGKSYSSLHALVHDMFPPMSSTEQEDFNSWNYWKLPLPVIDN